MVSIGLLYTTFFCVLMFCVRDAKCQASPPGPDGSNSVTQPTATDTLPTTQSTTTSETTTVEVTTAAAQSTTLDAQSTTSDAQSTTVNAESTTVNAQSTTSTVNAESTTTNAQSTTADVQPTTTTAATTTTVTTTSTTTTPSGPVLHPFTFPTTVTTPRPQLPSRSFYEILAALALALASNGELEFENGLGPAVALGAGHSLYNSLGNHNPNYWPFWGFEGLSLLVDK